MTQSQIADIDAKTVKEPETDTQTAESNVPADADELKPFVNYGASWLVHLHRECDAECEDGSDCDFAARSARVKLYDDGGIAVEGRCGHHPEMTWSPGKITEFDGVTVFDFNWREQTCEKSLSNQNVQKVPASLDGPSVKMTGDARVTCKNRSRVAIIASEPDGSYATKTLCLRHLRNVWTRAMLKDDDEDEGGDA